MKLSNAENAILDLRKLENYCLNPEHPRKENTAMTSKKRIQDYGIKIGELPKGPLNKISDVQGVKVGHCTIDTEEHKTGVTVILPGPNNIFTHKLISAVHVINGFGKSLGLMQIDELGTLETPIALTNTLNVGLAHDALVEYMIRESEKEKIDIRSFNPIVCECNDSFLNNIRKRAVKKEHVFQAFQDCRRDFMEGDIGAGKGISCHELKGGIGSASRKIELDGTEYTLGVLVQTNHGQLKDLIIQGKEIGKDLAEKIDVKNNQNDGSIIIVIATDIPCSSRQLKRICKRAVTGMARLGSYIDNGSGEIVIGFSTANIIPDKKNKEIFPIKILHEKSLNKAFRAIAEACEEAILNSMICASRVVGFKGNVRESLRDYI